MIHLAILFLLLSASSFAQKRDTLQSNVGKPGGFSRIREMHPNGKIHRVWFTSWNEDGTTTKSFSQYNKQGKTLVNSDSTFASSGRLSKVERKIGDSIEGEKIEFDSDGQVSRKLISIYYKGKYIVFIRDYNASEPFRAIIDGDPPERMPINADRFFEAERIFNEKAFSKSLSK